MSRSSNCSIAQSLNRLIAQLLHSPGPLIIPSKNEFTNSDSDRNILVGVVSYGLSSRCESGRNKVGFYTAIEPYASWIKSEIAGGKKRNTVRRAGNFI